MLFYILTMYAYNKKATQYEWPLVILQFLNIVIR